MIEQVQKDVVVERVTRSSLIELDEDPVKTHTSPSFNCGDRCSLESQPGAPKLGSTQERMSLNRQKPKYSPWAGPAAAPLSPIFNKRMLLNALCGTCRVNNDFPPIAKRLQKLILRHAPYQLEMLSRIDNWAGVASIFLKKYEFWNGAAFGVKAYVLNTGTDLEHEELGGRAMSFGTRGHFNITDSVSLSFYD